MIQEDESFIYLEPVEQKTVTEVVAQRLIALMSDGVLKPGDKLPPERELAERLHVGRTTVREALKLLTLSGLLEARRGDGTYVRQTFVPFLSQQIKWPMLLSTHEVDMIVEFREGLEVQAARLAAQRATPEDIERMAVFRELLQIEGRDIERETDLDLEFHHAIAAAAHNEMLSHVMLSFQDILRQYIYLSNQRTDRIETTVAEHQPIYDAIAAGDPDLAQKAMMDHLQFSREWIVHFANQTSEDSSEEVDSLNGENQVHRP